MCAEYGQYLRDVLVEYDSIVVFALLFVVANIDIMLNRN
jgi:hypothetical protein